MDEYSRYQDSETPADASLPHYGYKPVRNNSFMILSLCMGIFAITACSFIFASLTAAGLSILFAILSKGDDRKLQTLPKAGIITSVMGVFFSICITTFAFYSVFHDPTVYEQMNQQCEQMYGQSFDEMMQQLAPDYTTPFPQE